MTVFSPQRYGVTVFFFGDGIFLARRVYARDGIFSRDGIFWNFPLCLRGKNAVTSRPLPRSLRPYLHLYPHPHSYPHTHPAPPSPPPLLSSPGLCGTELARASDYAQLVVKLGPGRGRHLGALWRPGSVPGVSRPLLGGGLL